jgi:TonB family protein
MSEEILVVEYEPRYTERVKQALLGQSVSPIFARDGEEAIHALDRGNPKLIVLSSVIPKVATADLIRTIRMRDGSTPILLTVSGYNGANSRADASRVGANDILAKPYTQDDLLGKMGQLLGIEFAPASSVPDADRLTSNEIFGDLVDEQPKEAPKKPSAKASTTGNVDKLLEQTLSGMMPKKKTMDGTVRVPEGATAAKSAEKASSDIDRMLANTLSGLEKNAPRPKPPEARPETSAKATPVAVPTPPKPVAVPPPSDPAFDEGTVSLAAPLVFPRAERKEEEPQGDRFGQYVLQEKIATGGMAEVWKAQMRGVEGFQKTVAIKKILPHLSDNEDFVTMFIDEAKLAAQLNHNNIIHIYDLGKIASSYYIAMEYIDGDDLKTILQRAEDVGQPMPVEIAVFVASKIASALDYAHRKRDFNEEQLELVHRDVSPQNVLISHDGDIKLCDFGIAKAASKASHTQAGALKGKLQYMSPEQAWGKSIDRRSDIFALGAVLHEMLTGRKLFSGDSEISVLEQVRQAKFQNPSEINDEVPTQVDAIVSRALSKEPESRYQTAGEMARDLDAVLYTFRPTPTSADLAIYMHRLYTSAPHSVSTAAAEPPPLAVPREPTAISQAFTNPIDDLALLKPAEAPATRPVAPAPAIPNVSYEPAVEQPKRSNLPMFLAIGVLVVGGVGAAAYFALRGGTDAPSQTSSQAGGAPASATSPAPGSGPAPAAAPGTDTVVAPVVSSTTSAATSTVDERALIDQEVQRRLAAERARLEQQRAAQLAQNTQRAVAPPVETPRAAAPEPQQQAAAPPPAATQTTAPAPAQETRPEPAPAESQAAAAQPARSRQGDLVEPGTPGLVEPQLLNFRKPTYPPMAKMRKVEGIVVISALVNEDGRVTDVRVLRGVNQNVGINEAARDAVLGSTFRPATKDGVRVKTYKTITVPFKL